MSGQVMGIDVGTSSCKIGVFSDWGMIASTRCEYGAASTVPGHVEIDAGGAWRTIKEAVKRVTAAPGVDGRALGAISFSSLGEAVVPVRLDRSIVAPSILAHDCRGNEYAEQLSGAFDAARLFSISPNEAGPHYTFAKLMWIRDNEPAVYDSAERFLFWGDFLGFMFGADPYTTKSLANRSLLFDAPGGDWSEELIAWSGLARDKFAPIVNSGETVGMILPGLADELAIGRNTLIVSGGHDQGCNSLGCGCLNRGDTVVGMGTYECFTPTFLWPDNPEVFRAESMCIENHVVDGLYLSFLYNHSGTQVTWFRNTFAPEAGADAISILNAEVPDEPTRLLFLPHIEPPYWPRFVEDTAGVFLGLKTSTTRGEMFKALLEGITFSFVDAVEAMRRTGICPDMFLASGGSSRSDAWMQMRADILGVPFTRLSVSEGSLTGAATLAAVRGGLFDSNAQAVSRYVARGRVFSPNPGRYAEYREKVALYREMFPAVHPLLRKMQSPAKT